METVYEFEKPGAFARGWHIVSFSQELKPGDIKSLHYFNQDMVLYRTEDGRAAVLDAYCPHLGAHLGGTGSEVVGDSLRCPFHSWHFDTTGACTKIPYAKKIPERAKSALKSWPVVEKNGFIAVWYDQEDGQPNWELPDIPEWGTGDGQWGDWVFNRSRIRAQGREVIENIVDVGHFPSVHGGQPQQFDNRFKPYSVSQYSRIKMDPEGHLIQPSDSALDVAAVRQEQFATEVETDSWGDATYHGPSIMYFYTENSGGPSEYKSWWVNYHTPINDDEVELTSGVIVTDFNESRPLTDEFRAMYPQLAIAAFGQDVEVWKTKIYRNDPILCDGDGPINKLRKWYNRFYLPRSQEAWEESDAVISSVR